MKHMSLLLPNNIYGNVITVVNVQINEKYQ